MPRLKQSQSLRQTLSPQQVIQASILQLNISSLEEKVLNELESNPVLEQTESDAGEEAVELEVDVDFEEDPDEYEPANIYDNTRTKDKDLPVAEKVDFIEGLISQLDGYKLKDWERGIAEEILWNLDENGYLAVDTILIADRFNQTNESVINV